MSLALKLLLSPPPIAQAIGTRKHVQPPNNQSPLLPQPLRRVMGADARLHAAATAPWAAGKHNLFHTPIAMRLAPAEMSSDSFHPGEPIYRACGEALARFVVETILPMQA